MSVCASLASRAWFGRVSAAPQLLTPPFRTVVPVKVPQVSAPAMCVSQRWMSTGTSLPSKSVAVRYHSHGAVEAVTGLEEIELPPVGADDLLIRFICSPLNPADFNMIEGVYSITPDLPAIGGNEGVAEVLAAGSAVADFKPGDWVIPAKPGFGTWRTHAVCKATSMMSIANDIPPEAAATVAVNPCTAFRMLKDFVALKPGDVVVQNGATSAVGAGVIQLAKSMGAHTINIVRDRDDLDDVVQRLTELGGDIVVTEDTVNSKKVKEQISEFPGKVILGLNCVGGKSTATVARLLSDGSPLVTYGGMSRKPVTVPTGSLIFHDLTLRGFWLSRWVDQNTREERQKMIDALTDLIRANVLKTATESFPLESIHEAVTTAKTGFRHQKVLLTFPE